VVKKRVGRPRKPRRPVVSVRVHEPLYESLRESAAKLRLTISEDVERRLERSFEWERQFGDTKKLLADTEATLQRNLEAHLRAKGYQPIGTDQGRIWAEPGMSLSRLSRSVDVEAFMRAMQPELTGAVTRALAKVLGEGEGR
jgi:hypothetical protein